MLEMATFALLRVTASLESQPERHRHTAVLQIHPCIQNRAEPLGVPTLERQGGASEVQLERRASDPAQIPGPHLVVVNWGRAIVVFFTTGAPHRPGRVDVENVAAQPECRRWSG